MKRRVFALVAVLIVGLSLSPAASAGVSILCVGDSITCGISKPNISGGYRKTLEQLLLKDHIEFEFIGSRTENSDGMQSPQHEGWPGRRIEQITASIIPTLFAQNADIVLVLAGTNDARQNFLMDQAPDRLEVLLTLIGKAQPKARIIVGTLPLLMFDEKHPAQVEAALTYNRALPGIVERCRSHNLKVELLDLYPMLTKDDIVFDTVHPNESGYQKLGEAWYQAIKESPKTQ